MPSHDPPSLVIWIGPVSQVPGGTTIRPPCARLAAATACANAAVFLVTPSPTAPKSAMLNCRRWNCGRANAGTSNGALATGSIAASAYGVYSSLPSPDSNGSPGATAHPAAASAAVSPAAIDRVIDALESKHCESMGLPAAGASRPAAHRLGRCGDRTTGRCRGL